MNEHKSREKNDAFFPDVLGVAVLYLDSCWSWVGAASESINVVHQH